MQLPDPRNAILLLILSRISHISCTFLQESKNKREKNREEESGSYLILF